MHIVLRCPICGKKPKIIFEHYPTGTFVKFRCKPLFRKPHLEAEFGKTSERLAYDMANRDWNMKVAGYMCDVKGGAE